MRLDPDTSKAKPGDWIRYVCLDEASAFPSASLFADGDATLVRQRVREVRLEVAVLDCESAEERRLYLFRTVEDGQVTQTSAQAGWERVAAISPELVPLLVDGHEMVARRTYLEVSDP